MVEVLRRYRVPLLVTLLVAVAAELLCHRLLVHLLRPEVLQPDTQAFRVFNEGLGPFAYFFAGFLALSVTTWVTSAVVRGESVFSLPWRVTLGLFSCVFLPVAAVAVFVAPTGLRGDPQPLLDIYPYLVFSGGPVIGLLVVAVLAHPGALRLRLGLALAALPLLFFAYFAYRTAALLGSGPSGPGAFAALDAVARVPGVFRDLFRHGGYFALVAFLPLEEPGAETRAAAPGPAAPAPGSRGLGERLRFAAGALLRGLTAPGPTGIAVAVTFGLGAWIRLDTSRARFVLETLFALDVEGASGLGLLWLGSVYAFVLTVASLLWRPGAPRTLGLALLLLALGGCRLAQPLQDRQIADPLGYLIVALGLLAGAHGIAGAVAADREARLRAVSPPLDAERLQCFFDRLGSDLSARGGEGFERIAVGGAPQQEWLLAGRLDGVPLRLHLLLHAGRVRLVQLVLGDSLSAAPDWRGVLVEGPEGCALRRVQDRAGISSTLLDGALQDQLAEIGPAEVAVWARVGVRYRARLDSLGVPRWLDLEVLRAPAGRESGAPAAPDQRPEESPGSPGDDPALEALVQGTLQTLSVLEAVARRTGLGLP